MCIFSLADRIERTCDRFLAIFGINSLKLTTDQWGLKSVHITQFMVRKIYMNNLIFFYHRNIYSRKSFVFSWMSLR